MSSENKVERLCSTKMWLSEGPVKVATRVDVVLGDFRLYKYDASLHYKVNNQLGFCLSHESDDSESGRVKLGTVGVSAFWKCPADKGNVAVAVSKGKKGVKWAVGMECTKSRTKVAVN